MYTIIRYARVAANLPVKFFYRQKNKNENKTVTVNRLKPRTETSNKRRTVVNEVGGGAPVSGGGGGGENTCKVPKCIAFCCERDAEKRLLLLLLLPHDTSVMYPNYCSWGTITNDIVVGKTDETIGRRCPHG